MSLREANLVARALLKPGGLDRLLDDRRRLVEVAELAGELVGFLALRIEYVADFLLGTIEACYVRAGARGNGAGRALVEAALRWCSAQGCSALDAPALPGDRASKSLYEAAGFKARLVTMHRALGGDGR
jgi:GNAT superfamily N-acetyltransferase